jgi:hypothetical protein
MRIGSRSRHRRCSPSRSRASSASTRHRCRRRLLLPPATPARCERRS